MNMQNKVKTIKEFICNIFEIIKILYYCSPFYFIGIIITNIILGLIVISNIYVWKQFLDSSLIGITSNHLSIPAIWMLIYVILIFINIIIEKISAYFRQMEQENMNKYISTTLMKKIEELDISYFDSPSTFDAIEKVNNESLSRCMSILLMVVNFIRSTTTLISITIVTVKLSPIISISTILTMFPILFCSISIALNQYNIYIKRVQKLRYIDNLKQLCLKYENIKELKIYRAVPFIINKMTSTYNKYIHDDKQIKKKYIYKLSKYHFFQYACSYILKLYTLYIVIKSKLTIGDLTMYLSAIDNMESSIYNILDTISSLYDDSLYISNFLSLQNTTSKLLNGSINFTGQFESIEFKNVSFRYPHSINYAIKNISFKITSGKSYALVGLNGSGKTTLIKLIMRLYDPDEGAIFIDDHNIKEYTLDSLYQKIGIIFQDFIKYPLTVSENIGIGNLSELNNNARIHESAQLSGADEFISKLKYSYDTFLQKNWDNGEELSIGQWQKLAISRCYMSDASILILDEPSSSLDPQSEYELFQKFKIAMAEKTNILITHRIANVKIVDEILVLDDGMLAECGTHESLIQNKGLYYNLYNMQAEGYK